MAWQHSDWIEKQNKQEGIVSLRSHIREVSDRISEEYQIGSRSKSTRALEEYLENLKKDLATLDPSGVTGENTNLPFVAGRAVE